MHKLLIFILSTIFVQPVLSSDTDEALSDKLIKDAKKSYKQVVKLN